MYCQTKCSLWLFAILLLLQKSHKASGENEMCVMEGPCHEDLNCYRVRPPKPLMDRDTELTLKRMCPELMPNNVCCSPEQVEALDQNFLSAAAILGRCPSCLENFRKIFCHFTCSPHQADFVNITKTEKHDDGQLLIREATYYLNQDFIHSTYDSCKSVKGLTPNSKALELMCGLFGGDCNPQKWVDFMGSTPENGGFSPFQINFIITQESVVDKKFYPLNIHTVKCWEKAGENQVPCSRGDCEYPREN